MTYPSSMRVERLTPKNYKLFEDKLRWLKINSKDKNHDWWGELVDEWDTMFDAWYVVFDKDDNLIAFSAVESFENNQWRLMTRMWNGVRKEGLVRGLILDEVSPAMLMLEMQLKDFKGERTFISMEYINRRKFLDLLADKINKMFGGNWSLNDGMQQTRPNFDRFSSWQNTISEHDIELNTISVDSYLNYFEKERKKVKK